MDQQKSGNIQREIIDFVNEYGVMDHTLERTKRIIEEQGVDSPVVQNWLSQFAGYESVTDFMLRYSLDDEPVEQFAPKKTIDRLIFEERTGLKFFVSFDKIDHAQYVPGVIELLFLFSGQVRFSLQNGCRSPFEEYNPCRDLVDVTIRYTDGTVEKPYLPGHINLKDLYRIISKE